MKSPPLDAKAVFEKAMSSKRLPTRRSDLVRSLLFIEIDHAGQLMAAGHNPFMPDRDGYTPLHACCAKNLPSIDQELIEKGAWLEAPLVETGMTPRMLAAANEALEVCQALLGAGAKIDAKDQKGRSALDHAAQNDDARIVALLLIQKAKGINRALTHARESPKAKSVLLAWQEAKKMEKTLGPKKALVGKKTKAL